MGFAPDRSIIPNQGELNVAFWGCGMILVSDQSETNKPNFFYSLWQFSKIEVSEKAVLFVCCPNSFAIYHFNAIFFKLL